jgi:hypothetical protein
VVLESLGKLTFCEFIFLKSKENTKMDPSNKNSLQASAHSSTTRVNEPRDLQGSQAQKGSKDSQAKEPQEKKLQYYHEYYKKNKNRMNQQRLAKYYLNRYTPEQLQLLKVLKPNKCIPG